MFLLVILLILDFNTSFAVAPPNPNTFLIHKESVPLAKTESDPTSTPLPTSTANYCNTKEGCPPAGGGRYQTSENLCRADEDLKGNCCCPKVAIPTPLPTQKDPTPLVAP